MVLYEYFNQTYQLQPFAEAHDIFVVNVKSDDCGIVQDLQHDQRCRFIQNTESCSEHISIINYLHFVYCIMNATNETIHWLVMLLLVILICYMFTILGTTADKFFCPSLAVIATLLHMSENLAGVTILAFGNGSPDLFTSMSHLDGETTILYAEAYGASLFIIGVITAAIVIIQPFHLYAPAFIRDAIFLLFITAYVNYIMLDGTIRFLEAAGVVICYIVYLFVIILDQIIIVQASKDIQIKLDMITSGNADAELLEEMQELRKQGVLEVLGKRSHISLDVGATKSASFIGETSNTKLFWQFLYSVNPIDRDDWNEAAIFGKVCIILKAPAVFILLLVIPVVDYNKHVHGWSKLLNSLQMLISPTYVIIVNQQWAVQIFGVNIFVYILAISIPLMIIVFFTSRTDTPPIYHSIYALFTMILCIITIQLIANEVVTILDTIGIAVKLSPSFLGCTILAWGNSVGDLISNITLAKQGYHKMGFAACYGGPLFNIMLSMGITFTYQCYVAKDKIAKVRQGSMGPTCNIFLFFTVLFLLIAMALTKFQARRSIGIFTLIIYIIFLLYTGLGELEIIHPYGTDHQDQRVRMD